MGDDEPVFSPSDFLRYIAENKKVSVDALKVPRCLVMTYQRSAYEFAKKMIGGKLVDWWWYGKRQPFCIGKFNDTEIGLGLFWIGAPAAVVMLEELIACGVKTVFEVGILEVYRIFLNPAT